MSIFYQNGKDVKNIEELLKHYSWDECLTYKGHQGKSIFHIAARDGFMKLIEESCKSTPSVRLSLLTCENFKGETPLHVAAEYGRWRVVQVILQLSISTDKWGNEKSIIVVQSERDQYEQADVRPWRMRSANGDTPLHIAVRNGHSKAALILLRCDPELASCVNEASESVLYLAARSLCYRVVQEMLGNEIYDEYCSVSGPDGKSPLHAAAAAPPPGCPGWLIDILLHLSKTRGGLIERLSNLVNKADHNGKTPLHYAVEGNKVITVRKLLGLDKSAAFIYDNEGFTPLLRAAANGFDGCITSILDCCPHSAELHHSINYRTAIHLYNKYKRPTNNVLNNLLLNETDSDGNTALHCAILDGQTGRAATLMSRSNMNIRIRNNMQQTPYDLSSELMTSGDHNQVNIHEYYKLKRCMMIIRGRIEEYYASVYEVVTGSIGLPEGWNKFLFGRSPYLEGVTDEELKQILNNMAFTATLLVTLTFTAAFTIPGGYNQATGQVLRMKQNSVKLFLCSDVIAMLLGMGALINYTFGITRSPTGLKGLVRENVLFLQLSLLATVMAFTAGIYALASSDAFQIFLLSILFAASIGVFVIKQNAPQTI